MESNRNRKVFGVYQNEDDARRAIESLLQMGYTSEHISVVSRSFEGDAGSDPGRVEYDSGNDRDRKVGDDTDSAVESGLKGGAAAGAAIGGIGGLLAGLGLLTIPGIGPVLAAGPIAAALGGVVAGGAVGGAAGTIGGAIADAGVPEDDAKYIEDRFNAGDIIVYVDADEDRYDRTSDVLGYRRWNLENEAGDEVVPNIQGQTREHGQSRIFENGREGEVDVNTPIQPVGVESLHGNDPHDLDPGAAPTPSADPHVIPGSQNPVNPGDPLWNQGPGTGMTEEDRLRDEDFERLGNQQQELERDLDRDRLLDTDKDPAGMERNRDQDPASEDNGGNDLNLNRMTGSDADRNRGNDNNIGYDPDIISDEGSDHGRHHMHGNDMDSNRNSVNNENTSGGTNRMKDEYGSGNRSRSDDHMDNERNRLKTEGMGGERVNADDHMDNERHRMNEENLGQDQEQNRMDNENPGRGSDTGKGPDWGSEAERESHVSDQPAHDMEDLSQDSNFEAEEVIDEQFVEDPSAGGNDRKNKDARGADWEWDSGREEDPRDGNNNNRK